jgi:cytochrome c553
MTKTIVFLLTAALPLTSFAGGDAAAGKEIAGKVCVACHGADGTKPSAPDQPVLAGQYPDYLARALADYKSGKRENAIMKGMATSLSSQDMEDVAAWFSSQKGPLHNQR